LFSILTSPNPVWGGILVRLGKDYRDLELHLPPREERILNRADELVLGAAIGALRRARLEFELALDHGRRVTTG
jgi:hypothetical protein